MNEPAVRVTINGETIHGQVIGEPERQDGEEVVVISAEQLQRYGEANERAMKVTAFLLGLSAALFQ